ESPPLQYRVQADSREAQPHAGSRGPDGGPRPRHPSVHALALAEGSARRGGQGPEAEGGHALAIGTGDQAAPGAQARARDAEGGARAFKKSHPVLFRTKAEIFEFLDRQREWFAVTRMCALDGVTRSGDYAWRRRGESARRRQDRSIRAQIRAIFDHSRGTYGSPRIHRALGAAGVRVSRRRIARLMREAGLRARAAK